MITIIKINFHVPNNFANCSSVESSCIFARHSITDYEISPERPPIVGYTGHIPGARGEVALSKRYAQAAKKGLELVRKEREQRHGKIKNTSKA